MCAALIVISKSCFHLLQSGSFWQVANECNIKSLMDQKMTFFCQDNTSQLFCTNKLAANTHSFHVSALIRCVNICFTAIQYFPGLLWNHRTQLSVFKYMPWQISELNSWFITIVEGLFKKAAGRKKLRDKKDRNDRQADLD